LLIGLDGATWKLLAPWIEEGELPTFQLLKMQGAWGTLKSTLPPQTSPAIPSFYTGKNPGNHGVFSFLDKEGKIISSLSIKESKVWEIVNEAGFKCCVVNLPITYPPKKINGVMITGLLTPHSEVDYTYPKDLKNQIDFPVALEWEFGERYKSPKPKEEIFNNQIKVTTKRFQVLNELLKKDEFALAIFFVKGTDVVQHLFWNDQKNILRYYKRIDECIKNLLEENSFDYVIIFSDHGFGRGHKFEFCINSWLMQEGYLELKGGKAGQALLSTLPNLMTKWIPKKVLEKIKKTHKKISKSNLPPSLSGVNWEKTVAYADRFWGIFINKKIVGNKFCEKLKEEIITKLKTLKYKGRNPIREIYKKEEIYKGKYLSELPDIVFLCEEDFYPKLTITKEIFHEIDLEKARKDPNWHEGSHMGDRNGILIITSLKSKDIKEGTKIENAEIIDIVPTILHMLGIPIPQDLDGKVLKNIFKEASELYKRPIQYQKEIEKLKIKEKIKKLKKSGKI